MVSDIVPSSLPSADLVTVSLPSADLVTVSLPSADFTELGVLLVCTQGIQDIPYSVHFLLV